MEMTPETKYVIDVAIVAVLAVVGWFAAPMILPKEYADNNLYKGGVALVAALIGGGIAYFFHTSM